MFRIKLRARVTVKVEPEEGHVQVSIKDSGIGLSEEDIEKLFKPFPGIHHGINVSSTGLGLSIAKGIVELHGGEIWAESDGSGKGSTFTFTIPI
jgi:signal transduction histidine kinase